MWLWDRICHSISGAIISRPPSKEADLQVVEAPQCADRGGLGGEQIRTQVLLHYDISGRSMKFEYLPSMCS